MTGLPRSYCIVYVHNYERAHEHCTHTHTPFIPPKHQRLRRNKILRVNHNVYKLYKQYQLYVI